MLAVDKVYGLHTSLGVDLKASDKNLVVKHGAGLNFRSADAGHFYVTLRHGNVREVVKVVGRTGDTFTIERGQDNTVAQTFPRGACVDVEWNPLQLCEFVQGCVTGDKHKIPAGVVCMTCDTCIEYDDGGHIIKINGAKQC